MQSAEGEGGGAGGHLRGREPGPEDPRDRHVLHAAHLCHGAGGTVIERGAAAGRRRAVQPWARCSACPGRGPPRAGRGWPGGWDGAPGQISWSRVKKHDLWPKLYARGNNALYACSRRPNAQIIQLGCRLRHQLRCRLRSQLRRRSSFAVEAAADLAPRWLPLTAVPQGSVC
jgi:hypothetical protein